MKAIMVLFDSLNRHMLPPYGCDWTHAPNFARLARRSVVFDTAYVCSMPCMPARRDLLTGRPNFLHRGWGPLEPFDDALPELLKRKGVYTHLASDHYHYWEDGGSTYHNRYTTWEFMRGQEGDPWIGQVAEPAVPPNLNSNHANSRQDWINRQYMQDEANQSQERTFRAGLDFIERNHTQDNWFLQIECFDPHEPFFSHRKYKDLYPHDDAGPLFDWPGYHPVYETPEQVQQCRAAYAALLSMCDAHLGDVLDRMDRYNLWQDTMLILWTDHGFLLGEHQCWGKNWMPLYEEVAHTPFFVWDPRCGVRGERRASLVQPAIDLGPTVLDFFGVECTPRMLGKPLRETIATDAPVRQAAIFGYHGKRVNVTDGRYVYMRAPARPDNQPLYEYTLMPTLMRNFIDAERLSRAELAAPFRFTQGCPTLRIPQNNTKDEPGTFGPSLLFDLQADPQQEHPLNSPEVEAVMLEHMRQLIQACDAPVEQYQRLGIKRPT